MADRDERSIEELSDDELERLAQPTSIYTKGGTDPEAIAQMVMAAAKQSADAKRELRRRRAGQT
jgi:hypothetical protein